MIKQLRQFRDRVRLWRERRRKSKWLAAQIESRGGNEALVSARRLRRQEILHQKHSIIKDLMIRHGLREITSLTKDEWWEMEYKAGRMTMSRILEIKKRVET
jgi:hypothetical protein